MVRYGISRHSAQLFDVLFVREQALEYATSNNLALPDYINDDLASLMKIVSERYQKGKHKENSKKSK